MELTKMLFANFSASASNLSTNSSTSNLKSSQKFENYMSKSSASSNSSDDVSDKKDVSTKSNKSDKVSKNSNQNSKDNKVKTKETSQKDKNADTDNVSKSNDTKETKLSEDDKNVVSEKETALKEKVAEILGVDVDVVENVLEQLGINVFDIKNINELLQFLQQTFQVDMPSELLSVDGIKDKMVQIQEAVDETVTQVQELIPDVDFEELVKEISTDEISSDDVQAQTEDVSVDNDNPSVVQTEVVETNVKKDNTSLHNKNVFNDNADVEEVKVDTTAVQGTQEAMQENSGFNQQGFQSGNQNMNFESSENNINTNGITGTTLENLDKTFSQVISKTTSTRNVNTAEVINQIVEKFKAGIIGENVSEIKITLKPEYLGDVSLRVVSENGIVSAQFTAENQRVKEIIEANFNNLKDMLDEQGVQVSALSVSVGSESSDGNGKSFEFGQSKSSRRINDIINNSTDEVEEEDTVEYVAEDDVLQTSVNYTA